MIINASEMVTDRPAAFHVRLTRPGNATISPGFNLKDDGRFNLKPRQPHFPFVGRHFLRRRFDLLSILRRGAELIVSSERGRMEPLHYSFVLFDLCPPLE